MAVDLATAYVSIVPETRNLPGELARAFQRAGDQRVGVYADLSGIRRDVQSEFSRIGTHTVEVNANASGIRSDLRREFQSAGSGAGAAGGQAAGGGIADALSGMGGKGGVIGAALATAFTLAGVSAGGLFVKSLMSGMEREQALDITQARLGVDDTTMARIGAAAGRAYVDSFGESVGANTDTARLAIQSGVIDSGATAQELEQVIEQISGVSTLMGEEIPAVARAAGQAIKTGIAGDATEAFDLLIAAERNGLNVSEDVLDTVIEYGTQFRKLGLDGAEAFGLINQAVKNGARDADVAADAIKEFSIRVVDDSESTREAFQDLGFDADDLAARFAEGGDVARAATGELLAEIRALEDPVERNVVSLALFGTQAEDLGDALNSMNLDTAVEQLGQVGGAAENALGTMTGNAATSVESAKRSIEVTLNELSAALAQAFGPALAKLGDWVANHQPEMLGFLNGLVDAAFVAADAMLAFASVGLRAFADFADGASTALGGLLDPIGALAQGFGMLTGDDKLEGLGETLQGLDDKLGGVAERARDLADGIDTRARPALDGLRSSITGDITEAQLAAEVMRALGDEVTAIPTEHGIALSDNSPEVRQRLEELGIKVEMLPDGEVGITANTAEGQQRIDAFMMNNAGREIPVHVKIQATEEAWNNWTLQRTGVPGRAQIQGRAQGGVFRGRGGPTDDANLVRISDREHLAYITRAQSTNPATLPFLEAINSGWAPPAELLHGMVPGFADGGIASGRALSWARSQDGEPYVYGRLDCSGYLSGIYGELTQTASRFTTDSDFSAWGFQRGYDPGGFNIGTDGGSGVNGHMAGDLLGTNVESDGTNGIQFGGTADGPLDFPKVWHLPRDMWAPPETDDPSTAGAAPGTLGTGGTSGAGGTTGGGTTGLGGGASAGGAASGGTFAGQEVPAGVVPVWVINAGGGTTEVTPISPMDGLEPAPGASPTGASPAPGSAADLNARALATGSGFLNAQADQLLGDLGLRRGGGAIQALAGAVFDAMTQATAEAVRQNAEAQRFKATRYAGRPF